MEPRISIITIATDDLDRAARFYEAMGLKRHAGITDGVAFFQMGGAILGLFPRPSAEEDSGIAFAQAPAAVIGGASLGCTRKMPLNLKVLMGEPEDHCR